MTIFKWTIESVIAAVALVISAAGSLYTTSYHWGDVNQQIIELQNKNAQTETHVAKHDDQLAVIQQQNAAIKQSVDDIKDTVHDIQTQVRKPQRGNNQ